MTDARNIPNQILSSFDNIEDVKEYASSQYLTIIQQSKKITELERKLESVETKLLEAERKVAVSSAFSIDQPEGTSDTETLCVIQIAMLKGLAMSRELTLEETKKAEIFSKIMMMLKGKAPSEAEKKKEEGSKITTEQLLAMVSGISEQ